jgi:S1-C subfamily serine protease
MAQRGAFLGVKQRLLSDPRILEGRPGILIVQVLPDTSAARAGLQDGDIILGINGDEMTLPQQTRGFADTIQRFPIGTEVKLEVLRGDRQLDLTVRLGERPFRYADPLVKRRIQFAFSEMWTRMFAPEGEEELEYLGEKR